MKVDILIGPRHIFQPREITISQLCRSYKEDFAVSSMEWREKGNGLSPFPVGFVAAHGVLGAEMVARALCDEFSCDAKVLVPLPEFEPDSTQKTLPYATMLSLALQEIRPGTETTYVLGRIGGGSPDEVSLHQLQGCLDGGRVEDWLFSQETGIWPALAANWTYKFIIDNIDEFLKDIGLSIVKFSTKRKIANMMLDNGVVINPESSRNIISSTLQMLLPMCISSVGHDHG